MRIDLDHNATTRVSASVRAAMLRVLDGEYGNPSSIHEEGRRSRDLVERARAEVAALLGGKPEEVTFTSGGTEADVLGVVGAARAAARKGARRRVVSSPVEHPAVKGAVAELAAEGFEVAWLPVDGAGRIAADDVAQAVRGGAALVSLALANHELGNLYDLASLGAAARSGGAVVHCDAVQAAGKVRLDVASLGVDLLSVSAHKIHGPKGVGALWVRRGVAVDPAFSGAGHQERGMRAGTENVPGIVGFGVASSEASPADAVAGLRDRLQEAVMAIPGARRHGDPSARVGNTLNVAFGGVPGDVLVAALDLEGIAASTGAACTSGSVEPSAVLLALGMPRLQAAEAVRFSLGRDNTVAEIDRVIEVLPGLVARIRSFL